VFNEPMEFSLYGEVHFNFGFSRIFLIILLCAFIFGISLRGKLCEENFLSNLYIDSRLLWVNMGLGDAPLFLWTESLVLVRLSFSNFNLQGCKAWIVEMFWNSKQL